jgi:pantothenate kinase type III
MQGLITLDFGNTNPHAGFFVKSHNKWSFLKATPLHEFHNNLDAHRLNAHNSSIVLCEVKSRENEMTRLRDQGFLVTRVKDYWRGNAFSGMPVHYSRTLGEDRLIEAFYCFKKMKSPTLLIDAGTYVTMDVITESGFMGGYIIPGLQTYFECFKSGELLKDVPLNESFSDNLPQLTSQAMTESYTAFVAFARKLVIQHKLKNILITGGLMPLWLDFLKGKMVEAVVEGHPHLIHFALHYWMTTQIEPI